LVPIKASHCEGFGKIGNYHRERRGDDAMREDSFHAPCSAEVKRVADGIPPTVIKRFLQLESHGKMMQGGGLLLIRVCV
jgi:hypothetical protein